MTAQGQSTFPCTVCRTGLFFTNRIKFTSHVAATFQADSRYEEIAQKGAQTSTPFTCAHCGRTFKAVYKTVILDMVEVEPEKLPTPRLTDAELKLAKIVHDSARNGVLDAYVEALTHQLRNTEMPKNKDRHFAGFLREARRRSLPPRAYGYFKTVYVPNGRGKNHIEFWAANGIGMIMVNGRPVRFIPARCLNFNPANGQLRIGGVEVDHGATNFEFIQKTRFGYVPAGAPAFLEALRGFNRTAANL